MLEAYEAYGDYNSMAELTQRLIVNATNDAVGGTVIRRGEEEFDIGGEWRTITVNEGLSAALGTEITADTPVSELIKLCEKADVPLHPDWNRGQIILEMYEHLLEEHTVLPTFYRDFPTEVSPLTRAHRVDPRLAERWDLVAFGTEIGTAYSELIDPVEQRARFTAQSLLAAGGDAEAMQLDEDFLRALEYAMPPTGGMGMGVDRLLMMLTGASIRQSVLFPFVRPE
jgi:lysyl-tRNA synthetase class 2